MFDRRLRIRRNIKTTLGQRLVSAGVAVILAGCWRGCDACFLLVDSIMPCWPYNKLTAGRRSLVVGYTWSAAIGNRFMYNLWPTSDKTFQLIFSDAGHAGPALNLHWVNVSCLLGLDKYNIQYTSEQPNSHQTLSRCCFNVVPPSATLAQRWNIISSVSRVCWEWLTGQFDVSCTCVWPRDMDYISSLPQGQITCSFTEVKTCWTTC